MLEIRNDNICDADKWKLENKLWGSEDYHIPVVSQVVYDEEGFIVKFTVEESDPLREKKNHLEFVHEDSCVEFFANFLPETSEKYINFEVNALGCMNVAFRSNRTDGVPLKIEEIENFHIHTEIEENFWRVTYKIGYDFIKRYYPEFDIDSCAYIRGNFYKCGNKTEMKHYLSYFKINLEQPNFHCPGFFGNMYINKSNNAGDSN